MKRSSTTALLVGLTLALGLAGCGGDSETTAPASDNGATAQTTDATSDAGTTLQLAADPAGGLSFDQTELTAKSGAVAIELTNDSPTPHNVEVKTADGESIGASDTISESTTTLNLEAAEPGDYTFFCNIPGHEEGGMKGTLTVSKS